MADITLAHAQIQDWTAVAQNTIAESAIDDLSVDLEAQLQIQAALDSTTAHTGTRFIVMVSSNTSGDEDWSIFTEFTALADTANTDAIEDNPLGASSTTITLTTSPFSTNGIWLFIEDGTLADSELVFQTAYSTPNLTILDGTTNSHANGTNMYDVAISKNIYLPASVGRVKVVVDNTYDSDGSSLNYKVRVSEATEIA